MQVKMSTEVGPFDGDMTAGQLAIALDALPSNARVSVETWDSQRDGSGWRVRAAWIEDR